MSGYTPDKLITMFHSIPRFALVGTSGTVSNEFDPFNFTYLQGALFPAGGIFALAALLLIIFAFVYLGGLCCKRCRRKRVRKPTITLAQKVCGRRGAFLFFTLLNIGLLFGILGNTTRMKTGLQDMGDALDGFINLLTVNGDLMAASNGASLMSGMLGAKAAALDLKAATITANPPQAAATEASAQTIADGANTAATAAGDIGDLMLSAADQLTKVKGKVDIAAIGEQLGSGSYAVPAIFAVILIGIALTLTASKCCSFVYKLVAPLDILFTFLITILAGAFYAIGLIGSDMCAAPATGFERMLNATGASSDPMIGGTMSYYTGCGANPGMAPAGAYAMMITNLGQVQSAIDAAATANATVNGPNSPYASNYVYSRPYFADIIGNLTVANTSLTTMVTSGAACGAFDPVWSSLLKALCNGGIATVIVIFQVLIAASVLLVINVAIGADICFYHPGDDTVWMTEEEAAAKAAEAAASKGAPKDGKHITIELVNPNPQALRAATPASGQAPRVVVLQTTH